MQSFNPSEIGFVLAYLKRSPSDSLKKEAAQVIEFLQEEIDSLTQEADNRVQSLADQLAEAQQKCNDYMLKASI